MARIPKISQPTNSAGTMLSRPPTTVRLTNLSQFVPAPSKLGHSGQKIPDTMKYGVVWDGHQRQYLTAPPIKPMKMNNKLKRIAFMAFIAVCSSSRKTRTKARLGLASGSSFNTQESAQ